MERPTLTSLMIFAIDDTHHDHNYILRREQVLRGQIHNLTVQFNNIEVYTPTLSDSNMAML